MATALAAGALLLMVSPAVADTPVPVPTSTAGLVTVVPSDELDDEGAPLPEPELCYGEVEGGEEGECYLEPVPVVDKPVAEEPAPDVEPEPEPVEPVIVEGDGDWGWSDARDLARATG